MKNSFEPIVLAVTLGLLALVAALLAWFFPDIQGLTTVSSINPTGRVPKVIKVADLESNLAPLSTPQAWNAPTPAHRLFLSDIYLFYPTEFPNGNYIKKDDGTARTPGGILISWARKYHLDITNPNIDREDPDKDGFSNKTEFFNNVPLDSKTLPDGTQSTNPLDPKSHPSYLSRLRLAKVDIHPFHIEFMGVVNLSGSSIFQIQLLDMGPEGQPPLKKTGEPLGYEGWIIGSYVPKMEEQEDPHTHTKVTVDASTLEIDQPDTGRKVILPLRKIINSPDLTAHFVVLMPDQVGKEILAGSGKTFSLPELPEVTYMLIDASDDPTSNPGAVIRDTKATPQIKVPILGPNEWNDVPISPTSSSPANSR